MKFINPVGRELGDGVHFEACMCSDGGTFSSTKSVGDHCFHCGCWCGSGGEYRTGNRVAAVRTIRKS